MKLTFENGTFSLAGSILEDADFSPILGMSGPVRLNTKLIDQINSSGVRQFHDFVNQLGGRELTLVECSFTMIEAFIFVPALLGPEGSIAKIESLQVPYHCAGCGTTNMVLLAARAITGRPDVSFPAQACNHCKAVITTPNEVAGEYAVLREFGAL